MLLSSPPLRGLQLLGGGGGGRRDREGMGEGMGEGVGRKRFLEREGRREFESLHHAYAEGWMEDIGYFGPWHPRYKRVASPSFAPSSYFLPLLLLTYLQA